MLRKLLFLFLLVAGLAAAQNRVYEMRTYIATEGKLDAVLTRFRDHALPLFKRHGIESVGYWIPQDPERAKNTLIYIVAHPNREEARKNWKEFFADPDWRKAAQESEKDGKIVQKIESVFMDPTDFSPLK